MKYTTRFESLPSRHRLFSSTINIILLIPYLIHKKISFTKHKVSNDILTPDYENSFNLGNCRMVFLFLVFTLYPLFSPFANAKSQDGLFEHISTADGLSHNTVNCIMQDSKGFMWFGTDFGLNRYDGIEFTSFEFRPDMSYENSNYRTRCEASVNRILSICEDSNGLFLVCFFLVDHAARN